MTELDRERIADNIAEVRRRMVAACVAAGRSEHEVSLIAVTKTFPGAYVKIAADCGLTDVAESKAQEGSAKAEELSELGLTWHFVGRLQRNKAKAVVEFADVVQSVDRAALLEALIRATEQSPRYAEGRKLRVLLQVDLDPDLGAQEKDSTDARGGVHPAGLLELADRVAGVPSMKLDGLMAIAPKDTDPAECFARLAALSQRLQSAHPEAIVISAGMSGDYEIAIANGATWVRVGTALFGDRQLTSAKGDS